MDDATICYMCDSLATSREHVPPACFFPKVKGLGRDLRRNLITVPSCERHNSLKSKDDEYLRAVIVMMSARGNKVAQHQFWGKFRAATARKPHVYKSFFKDLGTVGKGQHRALKIDRERFNSCIDHLSRALFFHTYKRKWQLPIKIVSPNLYSGVDSDQMVPHQPTLKLVESLKQVLESQLIRGENPEVFKYRIHFDDKNEAYAFAAIFYDFFEVFSISAMQAVNGE